LKSPTSAAVSISKLQLSTTASLAMRLIKTSSLRLSVPELCFHPDSERLTDSIGVRLSEEEDGGGVLGMLCGLVGPGIADEVDKFERVVSLS